MSGSPSRPPFRPGELDEILYEHLAYEKAVFDVTRAAYAATGHPLALECLLLHSRNLRDFLFGIDAGFRNKAVTANDYVSIPCPKLTDAPYQVLSATRKALNAQLSHLSRDRTVAEQRRNIDKEALAIATAIETAWSSFLASLSPTEQQARLVSAVSAKVASIPTVRWAE